jgi:hypothetical protein
MDYIEINRNSWDEKTKIHVLSDFYDVKGFLSGKNTLKDIELSEIGNVEGKKFLHLQCHFGLDTAMTTPELWIGRVVMRMTVR